MSLREINRLVSSAVGSETRADEFITLARHLMLAKGDALQASHMAQAGGHAVVASLLERTVANPLTLANASELVPYGAISASFASGLRHFGCFDLMLGSMLKIPLRGRVAIVTSGASGASISETQVKPVSRLSLANGQLDVLKAVALVVLTDETLRLAGGGDILGRELRNALGVTTDAQFVQVITAGIATTPQTGTGPGQVAADIGTAMASMQLSSASKLFMLTSGSFAAQLSIMMTTGGIAFPGMGPSGGSIGALTVVATDAVPGTEIVLADASQIAAASDAILLDASSESLVQMSTPPDSPPSAATNLISLWQQNMTGLRAERYFGAERLRTTAVAVIQ